MVSHNPLGKVFTSEELVSIGDICVKHNILIISDEVFEFMHFTPNFPRLAAQSESISRQTMTVSSIGKAFNALGWRLGFVIGPARLIEHVKRAHIILGYTSPSPAQAAAAAVLRHADVTAFFEANRAEDFVRLSICKDHRTIDLAVAKLRRLRDYIKK
ncbi:MAG: hypothetical protein M1821_002491 [Bathelium mastoideum]|nr:MAG: hypothetical protein M1821_002491 [Bathelium mastoideum]